MLSVSDGNSCQDSVEVIIGAPISPMVSVADDTLSCFDDMDGTLTAIITPGGAPIESVVWSDGSMGETITALATGIYTVTVTGTDQCAAIDTAVIGAPLPLNIDSIAAVPPDCPGFSNGSVTVFVSEGTAPYHYAWSAGSPADTFNLLPALSAGSYIVTVTDDNGCTPLIDTIQLLDPPSIEAEFTLIDSVSCNGGTPCDGGATVIGRMSDGSSQVFDFTWVSGESCTGDTICATASLCQGWQSVTITDTQICSIVDSVFIPAPEALSINDSLSTSIGVTCFGDTDGSATVVGQGGISPYTYEWQDGTTENTISNQAPGSYGITITDANGCMFSENITIDEPQELIASVNPDNTNDVGCPGYSDGQIDIVVNGGNPLGNAPYNWDSMVADPSAAFAGNLPPGTYNITVTDTRGCMDVLSHVVNEPPPIVASIPPVPPPACFGFQTFVTVDAISGGNGGTYTFAIGVEQAVGGSIPIFVNGLRDSINIVLIDGNGCETDTLIEVTQPMQVSVELPEVVEVQLGDSVRLDPVLIHELPLDSIIWKPSDNLSAFDIANPFVRPLEGQEYTLTITDINGCSGSDNVFVDVDKNRNVYIPNAFTPNADGFNDEFKVFTGVGVQAINFIKIFDRWGELVFSAGDSAPLPPNPNGVGEWDGRLNGKVLNPSVLVYMIEIEFIDGVTLLYRGDLTVMH